jgi:hypothetical protein
MARLVCFYRYLDPRVESALVRYAPLPVEWVETLGPDMGPGARDFYARELEKRWGGEDELLMVEQDKEIGPGSLEDMLGCPELWCGYTYWLYPEPHTALAIGGFGVTRFSAQVRKLLAVPEFEGVCQKGIDRRFYDLLQERHGITMHIHGHVVHHHVYEPRPEAVRRHVMQLRELGVLPPPDCPPAPHPGLLPGSYRLT